MTPERASALPALDGLRGIACLFVVWYHAGHNGFVTTRDGLGLMGVALFFSLSGFLMAYHHMPRGAGARHWTAFLAHRFLRVYPTFAATVIACWLIGRLTGHSFFWPLFAVDATLEHLQLLRGSYIFWTIPVELKFYALFCAMAAALGAMPQRLTLPLLAVTWAALLALPLSGDRTSLWPHLAFFIGGMTAAAWHRRFPAWGKPHIWDAVLLVAAAAIVYCLATLRSEFLVVDQNKFGRWNYLALISPLTALAIVSAARAKRWISRLLDNRPMRHIGHISYSLYLLHAFIFVLAKTWIPLPAALQLPLYFLLALLLAEAWYRLLERPCIAWGKAAARKIAGS